MEKSSNEDIHTDDNLNSGDKNLLKLLEFDDNQNNHLKP